MVKSLLSQLADAEQALHRTADLIGDAAGRIEDLEDHVSRLENDLADAKKERHEQFVRAEEMLRAGMHPVDRAIDTAAGNAPRG